MHVAETIIVSAIRFTSRVKVVAISLLSYLVLYEIECGQASWGDSFTYLESRILQAPVVNQSQARASRSEGLLVVFFCRDFQHGACKFSKDHYGTLWGEHKWLQHICARCWVDTRRCSSYGIL